MNFISTNNMIMSLAQEGGGGSGDFELVYTTDDYDHAVNNIISVDDMSYLASCANNPHVFCCFVVCTLGTKTYTLPVYNNGANSSTSGTTKAQNGGATTSSQILFTSVVDNTTRKISSSIIKVLGSSNTPVDNFKYKIYKYK